MEEVLLDRESPAAVLSFAAEQRAIADRAEARLLQAAVQWADLHPPESPGWAAAVPGTHGEVTIGGEGTPTVAEFACAELAAAIGVKTEWGTALVGEALALRHRLPRCWRRVLAGDLTAHRARRIARATVHLSREAAGWVDAQVAPFAHRVGPTQTDRLVAAATARFDPETAEAERRAAADGRCFVVDHRQVSLAGTSRVYGELDLADALDLDQAIGGLADQLAALGSTQSLHTRRASALGELARHQLALDLTHQHDTHQEACEQGRRRRVRPRHLVLHVHLSRAALGTDGAVCRVENAGGRLVTACQVRDWCGHPDTRITIRPVLDLDDHLSVDAYEILDRLHIQARHTNPTCVFPWCTRAARSCDADHVIPHARGGPTCSCNLAPLCRYHHRLKTHAGWRHDRFDETTFLWTSPTGLTIRRDHAGTHAPSRHPPDT